MDLLKHFYPADDYGQRRDRLHQLWQEYRAEHVSDAFSLPGLGSVTVPVARSIGDYVQKRCPDFESWSNVMSLIQVALEICAEHRCDPLELAATIGMDNTAEILKQQWAQTDDRTPLEVLRDLGTAKEVMA